MLSDFNQCGYIKSTRKLNPQNSLNFVDSQATVNSTMYASIRNGAFQPVNDAKKRDENASHKPHRRIMGRRYPLTKTGYKYLDIGINAGVQSRVEIAIGNNNGKEIVMTYELWKILLQHAITIISYLENVSNPTPIQVGPLSLWFGAFKNRRLLHLESPTLHLSISRDTAYNLFNLEYCVDHNVQVLNEYIANVDAKFNCYIKISAAATNPVAACRLIRESESFDTKNSIDCELLAQVFAFL